MTGMLKLGVIGAAFAAVAAGGSTVEPTPSVVAPGSAMNADYGVWVEKGPRILSADGKPLTEATALMMGEEPMSLLPIDSDGRLILNRYLAGGPYGSGLRTRSDSVTVLCPGYHTRRGVRLLARREVVSEIRLEPIVDQPAMRKFQATATLPATEMGRPIGFDLVKGDWLPPHGWGTTEDLQVVAVTNRSPKTRPFSFADKKVTGNGFHSDNLSCEFCFVREGDGLAENNSDFERCTNTAFIVSGTDYSRRLFRSRDYLGRIDEISVNKVQEACYEQSEDASVRRTPGPERLVLTLGGYVNPEPGLRTLEPASAVGTLRPPVFHAVPEGDGKLAFGVSPDGRAAVLFGRADKGAKVPEIFERSVYTTDPASDLPHLETLFVDAHGQFAGRVVAGCPELRTLVLRKWAFHRLEEKAFADNPKLDTVFFGDSCLGCECAGNAFEGCSTNLTAAFCDRTSYGGRPWETLAVTNLFTKMVKVFGPDSSHEGFQVAPRLDFVKGTVDIPVVRLREDALELEYSDGRLLRLGKDGNTERLFK